MGYRSLQECLSDLERTGQLARVREEIDPHLEMAEVQRRVYRVGGPAILFERVRGCDVPAVSNLFGTLERCRHIFRDTLEGVRRIVRLKATPSALSRPSLDLARAPLTAFRALPRRVRSGPVLALETSIDRLPPIVSWPDDGGPFITLPQVYSESPDRPSVLRSNLGMYRVQLSGGRYDPGREVGLHYQIHRGIGAHHARAIERREPLRVSIFVGGPPAHAFAAVMPLPEGLSELLFAGMLAGRRFRYVRRGGHVISADADFCITGTIDPERLLPEGPFGDHLGYYSLAHDFPVLRVERVTRRRDAVWPFTVVGRPPQEDTSFGKLIHEIAGPMLPREIPGLRAVHAVDEAGVHPLLLAVGSERYVPYGERRPRELLTIANAVLGYGQCSLAKFLWIAAGEDDPDLDPHDVERFLRHLLERVDWTTDLHFQTRTTMDTLDYSAPGLNEGSKVVIAAAGRRRRPLTDRLPEAPRLPEPFGPTALAMAGVAVVGAPPYREEAAAAEVEALAAALREAPGRDGLPLWVLVDDVALATRSLRDWLWVTFTRSDPGRDVHGVDSFVSHKHWGCRGPLILDARLKPHHAPPLIEDPAATRRVDELAARGGSLHGIL